MREEGRKVREAAEERSEEDKGEREIDKRMVRVRDKARRCKEMGGEGMGAGEWGRQKDNGRKARG